MFDNLSDKLLGSLKKLKGQSKITEKNIQDITKEIRLSLLEADVNFKVVKSFIENVKTKALGQDVLVNVNAGEQFVKIVHEELKELLGGEEVPLNVKGPMATIMLVGLQGVGKTTSAAKLALYIRKKLKKKPGVVSVDIYRPAAIEQLKTLGRQNNIPCFDSDPNDKPLEILQKAQIWAKNEMIEVLILDTAGRLQIDESLMDELAGLKNHIAPKEVILVADAMLGQQSVNAQ